MLTSLSHKAFYGRQFHPFSESVRERERERERERRVEKEVERGSEKRQKDR
jgi:hypothetical protein